MSQNSIINMGMLFSLSIGVSILAITRCTRAENKLQEILRNQAIEQIQSWEDKVGPKDSGAEKQPSLRP